MVGSYPQPDWLVDREKLRRGCRRACAPATSGASPRRCLEQAQDDATLLAIRDMERAGIDILTDGEIRRESYCNRFATALDGIDLDKPGDRARPQRPPESSRASSGPIRRTRPVEGARRRVSARHTDRAIKITVPGPFTMTQQA